MSEKLKHKDDPVEMPSQFCDYWLAKAPEYQGTHPIPCNYCDEPIERGDRFFYIIAVNNELAKKMFVSERNMFMDVSKRGHVSHLKHAPEQEWTYDPSKRVLQPWEEHPDLYEPPPGWEKWKKDNEGILYG